MRVTIRHYYPLGERVQRLSGGRLDSPQAWDALRSDGTDTHFSISTQRDEWLSHCAGTDAKDGAADVVDRARRVVDVVSKLGLNGIESFGVGGAYLEYNIKKQAPHLWVSCSDVGEGWLARLRQVFVECDEIGCLDLISGEYPMSPFRLYLLNRIDTEFSTAQFRGVFDRLAKASAEYVLFIPGATLTLRYWSREIRSRIRHWLKRTPCSFAGYVRNRNALRSLWQQSYELVDEVQLRWHTAYLLRRRIALVTEG